MSAINDPMVAKVMAAQMAQEGAKQQADSWARQVFIACYAQFVAIEFQMAFSQAQHEAQVTGKEEIGEFQVNFARAAQHAMACVPYGMRGLGYEVEPPGANGKLVR